MQSRVILFCGFITMGNTFHITHSLLIHYYDIKTHYSALMTNQLSKQLPISFLSAASSKIVAGWVHIFYLQNILALHSLNLPVMEMAKQTAETRLPVRFAFFGQTRTKDKIMSVTQTFRQSFWSEFKISFAPAKMQPHLNEVIQKCSLQNKRHTAFSSGCLRERETACEAGITSQRVETFVWLV